MNERFKVETPSPDSIARHAIFYSDKDLHYGNIELVPSPEGLFGNTRPLHLDLGCGRGEYIVAMAEQYPERNFVGVDFHSKSLYFGINKAEEKKLPNIKFIRADIRNLIQHIPGSTTQCVSVLFPAPMVKPNSSSEVVREPIIQQVHRVLSEEEVFLFITDAQEYFKNIVGMISSLQIFKIRQISQSLEDPVTRYQKLWQSKGIPSNRAEFIKTSR